jgi:hypothetical protein
MVSVWGNGTSDILEHDSTDSISQKARAVVSVDLTQIDRKEDISTDHSKLEMSEGREMIESKNEW